jgi:hypothetical protein
MPFHNQSGFLDDGCHSALPPAETADSASTGGATTFPAHSTAQWPDWNASCYDLSVPEVGGNFPVPDSVQSYPVGSMPVSSHLGTPSVFPFDQSHVGWDGYQTGADQSEGCGEQTGTILFTAIDLHLAVNTPAESVYSRAHPALEMANQSRGTAVDSCQMPSEQARRNRYRVLNGPDVLLSAQSFPYPDVGWNGYEANGQRTICYGEMIQGNHGFRPAESICSQLPVTVNTAAKSEAASFGMRPTVSRLRMSRFSKRQSPVQTNANTNTSVRSHGTRSIQVESLRAKKRGSPHLFIASMTRGFPGDNLVFFHHEHECTSQCIPPSHAAASSYYVMRLGSTKVSAIDRINDMVLNPKATESTSNYVKDILRETVRLAEKDRGADAAEAYGVDGKSAESFRVRKYNFLKAFAFFLLEDLRSNDTKSIWVKSKIDSTSQCWNVRMSKLKVRVEDFFPDANFPDERSDPSMASDQQDLQAQHFISESS